MLNPAKSDSPESNSANPIPLSPPPSDEISTRVLLAELAAHRSKPLVFFYEGREVLSGYHVTEVKEGHFEGLDCGANPEAWRETFIQLWDIPSETGAAHMPAAKFSAIMNKVREAVPFDSNAKLTFEVSDGEGAIRLYRAESIETAGERINVMLSRRPASCKPRDRWLEDHADHKEQRSGGCGTKAGCCN